MSANRPTAITKIAPAAVGLRAIAKPIRITNTSEVLTRLVACSAPPVAWLVWLVMISCSVPSRSRDCTSQEALLKARNTLVRRFCWTSAAIFAGRTEIGHCSSQPEQRQPQRDPQQRVDRGAMWSRPAREPPPLPLTIL